MKKILILSLVIFSSYTHAFALIGAINDAIRGTKDAAYQAFMKAKIVQQIQIIKKNYDDSKEFYEYMQRINNHAGGISGYLRDEIAEANRRSNEQIYWQFRNDMNTAPDDKRYIKNYIDRADKKASDRIIETGKSIEDKIHYVATTHDRGKKRDDEINDFNDNASKSELKEEDRKKLDITYKALSLETLSSIDRNTRQLIKMNIDKEQMEFQERKDEIIERMKFYESMEKMISQYKQTSPKKDAFKVLKETPKLDK